MRGILINASAFMPLSWHTAGGTPSLEATDHGRQSSKSSCLDRPIRVSEPEWTLNQAIPKSKGSSTLLQLLKSSPEGPAVEADGAEVPSMTLPLVLSASAPAFKPAQVQPLHPPVSPSPPARQQPVSSSTARIKELLSSQLSQGTAGDSNDISSGVGSSIVGRSVRKSAGVEMSTPAFTSGKTGADAPSSGVGGSSGIAGGGGGSTGASNGSAVGGGKSFGKSSSVSAYGGTAGHSGATGAGGNGKKSWNVPPLKTDQPVDWGSVFDDLLGLTKK